MANGFVTGGDGGTDPALVVGPVLDVELVDEADEADEAPREVVERS